MPKDLPEGAKELGFEPRGIYEQLMACYGRADSPRLFTEAFKGAGNSELGIEEVSESILVEGVGGASVEGIILMHIDGTLILAEDPMPKVDAIDEMFPMGTKVEPPPDKPFAYTGLDIVWDAKGGTRGRCTIGQEKYADEIKTTLTDKQRRRQFGIEDLVLTQPKDVQEEYKPAHQAWTGVLGWLAKTQRQLPVAFSEISRNSTRPSKQSDAGV